MEKINPEKTARQVLDACADCDVCRFLMDTSCLFFPELYRLYDRRKRAASAKPTMISGQPELVSHTPKAANNTEIECYKIVFSFSSGFPFFIAKVSH